MKYKVLKGFYDGQDNKEHYRIFTEYPREGLKPTKVRLKELAKGGFIELPKEEKPKAEPKKYEPKEAKPETKKDSE